MRGPSTRKTFVAPRLPEPCFRRSTPFHSPAMYAAGIDPSAYAATSARTSVISALAAHQDAQWIAIERVRLAKAVVQEPDVVLGDEVGIVAEDCDRRRRRFDLRRVIQPDVAPRGLRRLASGEQLGQSLIDLSGWHPAMTFLVHLEDDVERFGDTLPGESGSKQERHEIQERGFLACGLLVLRRRLVILLGDVPFVDYKDQGAPALPGQRRDLEILVLDLALGRVDHEDADVGALDGSPRPK